MDKWFLSSKLLQVHNFSLGVVHSLFCELGHSKVSDWFLIAWMSNSCLIFRSLKMRKSLLSHLLLILEVWDLKTTYGKLCGLHICLESNLTFDPSFNVKWGC